MKTNGFVSKAQQEVWEWKERARQAVQHLPFEEQVREMARQAQPLADEIRALIAARKQRAATLQNPHS